METRKVSVKVPLAQVPFIMRALGYYPTEQEVYKPNNIFIQRIHKAFLSNN